MPNAIKNTSVYPNIGLSRIGSQDNSFISLEPGGGIGPTGNIYGWYNGIVPLPGKYIVYINDSTPTGFDAGPK